MHKLAVIYGSDRTGRFCEVVGGWVLAELARLGGFEVDLVDPARLTLPRPFGSRSESVRQLGMRLAAADAFLVVTPEYNRSFPGVLKELIDSESEAWRGKPVAFVSYGGISGGLRAVEQLRLVFAELHAVTVRDAVSFSNARDQFNEGRPADAQRAAGALRVMMSRLAWWSAALKAARRQEPYPAAA